MDEEFIWKFENGRMRKLTHEQFLKEELLKKQIRLAELNIKQINDQQNTDVKSYTWQEFSETITGRTDQNNDTFRQAVRRLNLDYLKIEKRKIIVSSPKKNIPLLKKELSRFLDQY